MYILMTFLMSKVDVPPHIMSFPSSKAHIAPWSNVHIASWNELHKE